MSVVGMEDVTEALRKQRSSSAVNGTRGPAVERLMMDGEIVVECDLMILGLGKQNPDAVHGRYYEHSQAQTMPARDIAYEVLKQAEDTGSYLTQCRAGQRVISADFKDLFEIVLGLQLDQGQGQTFQNPLLIRLRMTRCINLHTAMYTRALFRVETCRRLRF